MSLSISLSLGMGTPLRTRLIADENDLIQCSLWRRKLPILLGLHPYFLGLVPYHGLYSKGTHDLLSQQKTSKFSTYLEMFNLYFYV